MTLSQKQKGILALVGLAFTYATFGFFTRYLAVRFGFFQQLYLRIIAGLLLGFVIFARQFDFSKLKKIATSEWLLIFFRSLGYYLLGAALFNKAVLLTKISTVAFIGSIPMTAILGFILLKEEVTLKKVIYIMLSFVGVAVISVKGFSGIFSWGQGEIFALLSCFFASLAVVSRRFQSKLLNNVEITQLQLFFASLLIVVASIVNREGTVLKNWSWPTLLIVFLAGFMNTAMIFLTNYGFEHIKTSIASNVLTLEMFFAVFIGFIFYREIPSWKDLSGAALILFSVIKMNQLEAEVK